MRILLIAGHGDGDPGACYNGFQEWERARALVAEIAKRIHGAEVDVFDATEGYTVAKSRNCYHEIRRGRVPDFSKYGYVLEVHLNASAKNTARGSMFYIDITEKGHSVEDAILRHMYAVGFTRCWDGVVVAQRQFPKGLAVQRACRNQGVSHGLLETCFISSAEDMEIFNNRIGDVAQAVADGIAEGFKLTASNETARAQIPYEVSVSIKDLNIRSGPGTNYSVIGTCPVGAYHIVDEETGPGATMWGKLKSGAGWISLDFAKVIG